MSTQQERPWPAIDIAELRYGLAFDLSHKEMLTSCTATSRRSGEDSQPRHRELRTRRRGPEEREQPRGVAGLQPVCNAIADRACSQTGWVALSVPRCFENAFG
jgi:hypothetical protein